MTTIVAPTGRSLNDRVMLLLPRVTYRQAIWNPEREEIFRMRYAAYRREGSIPERADGMFSDPVDDAPNCYLVGVEIDGRLAASIRMSVTMPDYRAIPTADVFPDVLNPKIDAGAVIVDPTRFVCDRELSREFPELPYITLRAPWLAMEHFSADIMLAAIRPEHQAFYRRLWGNETLCEPRPYPNLAKPVALTALHYPSIVSRIHERYPFFQSTRDEREVLFGPEPCLAEIYPLTPPVADYGGRP